MKNYKWLLIGGNLILLLAYFNWSVFSKEQTLKAGELVLFRLAPVDPRSLMQGDYMILNYEVADVRQSQLTDSVALVPWKGYAVIALDSNRVARIVRIQPDKSELAANEQLIKYHMGHFGLLKLGAESFFFEEGKAELYSQAVYGGLRIDRDGNSILVGMYDEDFCLIP